MLYLRPHHLLCIRKYIGKGYSKKFTDNMDLVVDLLNKEPFILISSKDQVCKACPNMIGNRCITQSKVDRYDERTLAYLKLELNKEYMYGDLLPKIDELINNKEAYLNICGDCQWSDICHK